MKTKGFLPVLALIAVGASVSFSAALFGADTAQANTYSLTQDNCTGGCSTAVAPFGTVQVLQNGQNLDFTVSLNNPYVFQKSTGLDAFVFGLSVGSSDNITNLASGFSVDTTLPQHEDGFGDFLFGITKAATGGPSLTFTFTNALLANLVLSTGGGTNALFAADILGNGSTGPVGALTATPLPAALPLFMGGLAAIGLFGRRKTRKLAAEASA